MAINFNALESAMASSISSNFISGLNEKIGHMDLGASGVDDLAATYTWDGTTTVTTADTSEVTAGDYIQLKSDGGWFKVDTVTVNTSVTLDNLYGLVIPSGSTTTAKSKVSLDGIQPVSAATMDPLADAIAAGVRTALETFADDAEISGVSSGSDTVGPGVIA